MEDNRLVIINKRNKLKRPDDIYISANEKFPVKEDNNSIVSTQGYYGFELGINKSIKITQEITYSSVYNNFQIRLHYEEYY